MSRRRFAAAMLFIAAFAVVLFGTPEHGVNGASILGAGLGIAALALLSRDV